MNRIKAALFAALLIMPGSSPGIAQTAPANMPAQSVFGRLGIPGDTGPGQAIPMARLNIFLLNSLCQINGAFPIYSSAAGAWICSPTQTANRVFAGPATGAAALAAFRALVGADLPLPAASTLGGVMSKAAVASNWLRSIGTDGIPTASQPNFTDLAGSIAAGQIPANVIANTMIRQGVARSVVGVTGNAGANVGDIQGTTNQVLRVDSAGTSMGFGAINLAAAAAVTGTLPVANGGTGDTGTAWTAYTSSAACGTATITVNAARSKTLGKTTWVMLSITFTAVGTCTATLLFNLPNTPQSDGGLAGREPAITGKGVNCSVTGSSAQVQCSKSDFSNVTLNERWQISGVYENQ